MNNNRNIKLQGPFNLSMKTFVLLARKCFVPIKIKANFTYCHKTPFLKPLPGHFKLPLKILFYRAGMQSHHCQTFILITLLKIYHYFMALAVNSRHEK